MFAPSMAVNASVDILFQLVSQEISRFGNLRGDVEKLRDELTYIRRFITHEQENPNPSMQKWLSDIKDIADEAVTILREYVRTNNRNDVWSCICGRAYSGHKISKKIQDLRDRLQVITERRAKYDIPVNVGKARDESSSSRNKAHSYDQDRYNVDMEDVEEKLKSELLMEEKHRKVISIYGMGGLGKTTLARKFYKSMIYKFTSHAWVCVSQEYTISDLLLSVIKSFRKNMKKDDEIDSLKSEEDLTRYLLKLSQRMKYLLVIDDVWSTDVWEKLKHALPENNNGSRVIITTRKKDVAERVDDPKYVHELRSFTFKESWKLFSMIVQFREGGGNNSSVKKELGKEMVDKCDGLPLAITVLGSLLARKERLEDWYKVKKDIWKSLEREKTDIKNLLTLSYLDLPANAKNCLLYLGMFPEDSIFSKEKAIRLWIAEGFTSEEVNNMEDLAEEYLEELLSRCLIQEAQRFNGLVYGYKMHDLVRDLAIRKANEKGLFSIYEQKVGKSSGYSGQRTVIYTDRAHDLSPDEFNSTFKSISFLNQFHNHFVKMEMLAALLQKFKDLRVLDLSGTKFTGKNKLDDALGKLIELRYLGLMNCGVEIPESISKLINLQTLEALGNRSANFANFGALIELRHLLLRLDQSGTCLVDHLHNLRTLRSIDYSQWLKNDGKKLVNLRELSIHGVSVASAGEMNYSLESIAELSKIETLTLIIKEREGNELPSLKPLAACKYLFTLWLRGKTEGRRIESRHLPKCLTVLVLKESGLLEDPMPTLGKMEHLKHLELIKAYGGESMNCLANGFPSLEYLSLWSLVHLRTWKLGEGAMPKIRGLNVNECKKLMKPKRLESVPQFTELELDSQTSPYSPW